jgi:hypothetical protein
MSVPVGKIALANVVLIIALLVVGTILAVAVDRTFGENIISTCVGIVFGASTTTVVVARNMGNGTPSAPADPPPPGP